ncbi:hypothetical protein [Paenibacillus polymyxa]|uniref:hypothetical protein n=1 Tax=Paenibacillus polymyxa TaxID=1406 RepID=UPI0039BE03ED
MFVLNFEDLAQDIQDAANDPHKKEMAINRFVRSFFKESDYWVACQWKENEEDMEPFVGYHNETIPCFYVFTDAQLAYNFSHYYGLSDPEGKCYAMKLPMTDFVKHIESYEESGVELVMFNEGGQFFAHNIENIIEILKNEN